MLRTLALATLSVSFVPIASAQSPAMPPMKTIAIKPGDSDAYLETTHKPLAATEELEVSVFARLAKADSAAEHDGKLVLKISSTFDSPESHSHAPDLRPRLIIEIPLSSANDAYGESRACRRGGDGALTFVYTAGLDEDNFVPFKVAQTGREFRFLLNKYLCRALAASYQCSYGPFEPFVEQKLPSDMTQWKVGEVTVVELDSKGAQAQAESSAVKLTSAKKPFDYASCAKIAPSDGLCCVGNKTTTWHCGGTPVGEGWHKVSGDCYHRETGGSCSDTDPPKEIDLQSDSIRLPNNEKKSNGNSLDAKFAK